MKTISHLVAVSNDLVIGVDNDLPWNLKDDLAHFKKYTLNKIIIMGRKTYESIGRPLPNRINYVISRTLKKIDGADVFNNLEDAMNSAEKHNKKECNHGAASKWGFFSVQQKPVSLLDMSREKSHVGRHDA